MESSSDMAHGGRGTLELCALSTDDQLRAKVEFQYVRSSGSDSSMRNSKSLMFMTEDVKSTPSRLSSNSGGWTNSLRA